MKMYVCVYMHVMIILMTMMKVYMIIMMMLIMNEYVYVMITNMRVRVCDDNDYGN